MQNSLPMKLVGIAGRGGAGKDTIYELVLKPRGFLRLQMTLYRKIWLVSTGRTWEEIFVTKPPHIRKLLQEDITQVRYDQDEEIWLRVLQHQMRALQEIVGVQATGFAVTDLRFLIEMRGIKAIGGKILHLEAVDTNVPVEMQGHRSETELDSPEMKMLRDSYLFNEKNGLDRFKRKGNLVLQDWGWA